MKEFEGVKFVNNSHQSQLFIGKKVANTTQLSLGHTMAKICKTCFTIALWLQNDDYVNLGVMRVFENISKANDIKGCKNKLISLFIFNQVQI